MKKKVNFIISNLAAGGAQRVVSNLSRGLSEKYNLCILLHDNKEINYPYEGKIVDLGTPVKTGIIGKAFNIIRRIIKTSLIKTQSKAIANISFLESSNIINIISFGPGKNIVSVRNYKSKQLNNVFQKIQGLMIKYLYIRSDLIVTPSKGVKEDLANFFRLPLEKIAVINNPYDLDYIENRSEENLEEKEENIFRQKVIITVGSLTTQKGFWHLIRAFSAAKKDLHQIRLVIIGDGCLKKYLNELAEGLGVEDEVFFLGYKDNPFKYLNKASVFVLPSLYEGFPNVLVEAMACGLPVISTDCRSGPREIIAPNLCDDNKIDSLTYAEYGILIPVCGGNLLGAGDYLTEEEIIMKEAIISLISNDTYMQEYRKRSRQRAEHFRLEDIASQWMHKIDS